MTIDKAINELQLKLNLENELVDQNMDFASAIKIEAKKAFILSRIKKGQENAEVFRMAIKALEKQIPKKAKQKLYLESDDMYVGQCPNCNFGMNSEMNYCDYCGQRLDWSEDE